jgi:hypothetical protein
MDLDFPGEISGVSLYFAPGFALGYATLLADILGPEEGESAARLFAAHDFSDTFAYGISADHWHPWPWGTILARGWRTHGRKDPSAN